MDENSNNVGALCVALGNAITIEMEETARLGGDIGAPEVLYRMRLGGIAQMLMLACFNHPEWMQKIVLDWRASEFYDERDQSQFERMTFDTIKIVMGVMNAPEPSSPQP